MQFHNNKSNFDRFPLNSENSVHIDIKSRFVSLLTESVEIYLINQNDILKQKQFLGLKRQTFSFRFILLIILSQQKI